MAERYYEPQRLETFADGVFAIAITLLIIEIKVPHEAEIVAAGGFWPALWQLWPSFLAYLISFVTIGIMWINHHMLSQFVRRCNRRYMLVTVAFLLTISFVPFSTAVLAEHLAHADYRTGAVVFYSAWFVAVSLGFNAVWWAGTADGKLLGRDVDRPGTRWITRSYVFGPVSYGAATGLALVNVWASLALHAALASFWALAERPTTGD